MQGMHLHPKATREQLSRAGATTPSSRSSGVGKCAPERQCPGLGQELRKWNKNHPRWLGDGHQGLNIWVLLSFPDADGLGACLHGKAVGATPTLEPAVHCRNQRPPSALAPRRSSSPRRIAQASMGWLGEGCRHMHLRWISVALGSAAQPSSPVCARCAWTSAASASRHESRISRRQGTAQPLHAAAAVRERSSSDMKRRLCLRQRLGRQ